MNTPTTSQIEDKKLYGILSIIFLTLIFSGGLISCLYMLIQNFKTLGEKAKAKKIFILGIFLITFSIIISALSGSTLIIPALSIPLAIFAYVIQYNDIRNGLKNGLRKRSFFKVLLILIISNLITIVIGITAGALSIGLDFRNCIMRAKHGDVEAAYVTGIIFEKFNNKKAIFWLQKASDLGSAEAANDLGVIYSRGIRIQKNHMTANKYYQLAADRGDYAAMYNIGLNYSHLDNTKDNSLPTDYKKAAEWYKKSIQVMPNRCAFHDLAVLYATGKGFNKDMSKSKEYFKLSCKVMLMGPTKTPSANIKKQPEKNELIKSYMKDAQEGITLKINEDINKDKLIKVYSEYQYSQTTGAPTSDILRNVSPQVLETLDRLSNKVKECWE